MALNGLFCADVPLRNYSLTHRCAAASHKPSGRPIVSAGSAVSVIQSVAYKIHKLSYIVE